MVFLTGARSRRRRPLAVFHLAVVLEERHVVGGGLDAQHDAVLVVHLDRALAEAVLDAGAFDAGGELRADLLGQQRRDLSAEEAGTPPRRRCEATEARLCIQPRGDHYTNARVPQRERTAPRLATRPRGFAGGDGAHLVPGALNFGAGGIEIVGGFA